jgi:predicted ATPase/DNA-binding XRE family transcriptional regulator
MRTGAPGSFGAYLKGLRVTAGFTQEELATNAGLSVHAVSALERGERRRPHMETVRALASALGLQDAARDALVTAARTQTDETAVDELSAFPLPVALTELLGRDADLQILQQWLDDPLARLITVVGPGGVGKTRLALEIAHAVADNHMMRVGFVQLAAIRDPAFVASAIAEALGPSDATAADLRQRVSAACNGQRPMLLVLDNCEHVLDAAPLVVDLLTSAPSLRVLATSRAPLRVRGERLYPLGPLDLDAHAETLSPADLMQVPAVHLFVERVRGVRPEFRVTSTNAPAIIAICRRLDALPLGLELAAPWIKVLTPEGLLRRLEQGVLLPTLPRGDLPERQQTLSATVAWSYQLLEQNEQRAFRRLGALPGRFPLDAAAAVCVGAAGGSDGADASLHAVAALTEKSLLHHVEGSMTARPLYQMLETVRAFAALELDATGERDDALEGLAQYCSREAAGAEAGLVGPSQIEWLDRVRDDLHNYRTALTWLIERRRSVEAADIAWRLMFFWLIRGRAAEGLRWYQQILSLPDLPPTAESRMLAGTAVMSHTSGNLDQARTSAVRALTIASEAGETTVMMHAQHLLGHVEQASGNVDQANVLFAQCIDAFKAAAMPWGVGNALIGIASAALAVRDVQKAERLLDEATSVLRHAGPWFLNLPLYIHAIVAVQRGDADATIALVHESLLCSRDVRDRFAFVYALVPLAAAARLKGKDAWAAKVLGTRDAITERTGATVSSNSVQQLRAQVEQEAQARLGLTEWARAYESGRTVSIDSLLHDIENASVNRVGSSRMPR